MSNAEVFDPSPPEYPPALAARIISRFAVPRPIESFDFAAKGNINQHTFLIRAGLPDGEEFLLQRINQQVFVKPRSVMAAMMTSLEAQSSRVQADPAMTAGWVPITLIPTSDGEPYLIHSDRRGSSCWRLMIKIPASTTYKSLSEINDPAERLRIASEAGRGLALYGDLTASVDTSGLASPLPGYRDTRVYFNQLHAVLAGCRSDDDAEAWLPVDREVRESTKLHFRLHVDDPEAERRRADSVIREMIDLVLEAEPLAMSLLDGLADGSLRTVAIHGDTKLDNFLFDTATGRVKSMVDLDTVMPHTWLVDWGDMVRSLANVAGEKERDREQIQVDLEIYGALAKGFLGQATAVTPEEVALMPEAVEILALELGVRFLSDWLRGDSYFRLSAADPPDLNRVRAIAQLTLFQRLRATRDRIREMLREAADA